MDNGSDLMFHISGGCCDGSSPMCFKVGEYLIGDNDIKIGIVDHCAVYMNSDQFTAWEHTDLIIDAINGIGGMFSLDNGTGKRFLLRSLICQI